LFIDGYVHICEQLILCTCFDSLKLVYILCPLCVICCF